MLIATLYGQTVNGKTMTEIKRKASRIANGFHNAFDCMEVNNSENGVKCTYWRYNRKFPNNAIQFGKWN